MGSGKSYAFCYEALFLASINRGLLGLIGAPTYRMLRDATKRSFLEILELEEMGYTAHKSENRITLHDSGSEIIFRSLDNYENLRGPNLAWFGVDELTYCKKDAWSRLEARLRHPKAVRLCGFAAWTPKGYDHVWEKFIDQPGKDFWAVRARPRENVHVSKTGLYDRLAASYDDRFFKQEVLGEYLSLSSGAVYHAFNREKNVVPVTYNPLIGLCWALDFNINPMVSAICQIEDESTHADMLSGRRKVRLNVLDEIILPRSNTAEMCEEFVRRLQILTRNAHTVNLDVYGDPAGNSGSTASSKSDWQIIREHLGRVPGIKANFNVPAAHPAVKDRTNAVNGMLCASTGERKLFVASHCKELIRDLEQVVWKEDKGGNTTGMIDKSDGQRTHISDALGYLVYQEFKLAQATGYRSERLF